MVRWKQTWVCIPRSSTMAHGGGQQCSSHVHCLQPMQDHELASDVVGSVVCGTCLQRGNEKALFASTAWTPRCLTQANCTTSCSICNVLHHPHAPPLLPSSRPSLHQSRHRLKSPSPALERPARLLAWCRRETQDREWCHACEKAGLGRG